jgi:hypothetical protein
LGYGAVVTGQRLGVEEAVCEVEDAVCEVVEAVLAMIIIDVVEKATAVVTVVVAIVAAISKESGCAKYSIFLS